MPNPVQAVASAITSSFPFTVTPFDVALSGVGSSTSTGGATIVEYAWYLKDKPTGSAATITQPSGTGSPVATLVDVDLPGSYLAFLRVKDSTGAWSDDFLPASDNARVVIAMLTQYRDWTIPARGERLWDGKMYDILIGLDNLLGISLVDDVTIGFNGSTQLFIKNAGVGTTQLAPTSVTAAKLGSDVAGSGLGGGNGSALLVNVDNTGIEISGGSLRLKDGGVSTAKLAPTSVTSAKLGAIAGSGLGGGSGSALSVNVDNTGIEISGGSLRLKDGGVSTDKMAATSVTAAKLGSDVAGSGLGGGNGAALSVNVDGTTIQIVGDVLQAMGTSFNPDDTSLEVNSGTARIKAGGVTLPKAGSGIVIEPGRPDFGAIGLIGGGNFDGGEQLTVEIAGTPIGTITLANTDDITDLAAILNAPPYSDHVRATVLDNYIDVVISDPAAIQAGRLLELDIGGAVNLDFVKYEDNFPLASGKGQVCGHRRRIETFDVTRGVVVFDFNFTIVAAIVQGFDGSNKIKEDWDAKVTWSGTRLKIEDNTATVTLASISQIAVLAFGEPV